MYMYMRIYICIYTCMCVISQRRDRGIYSIRGGRSLYCLHFGISQLMGPEACFGIFLRVLLSWLSSRSLYQIFSVNLSLLYKAVGTPANDEKSFQFDLSIWKVFWQRRNTRTIIQRLCEAPAFIAGVPIVCKIFARKAGQGAFVDCNKLAHQQGMIRNMWQPFLMYTFEVRSHSRHVSHHNKHTRSVKFETSSDQSSSPRLLAKSTLFTSDSDLEKIPRQ